MKKAIFPGSFDPIHQGHIFIINKALKTFDMLYVVVSINWQKRNKASLEKRYKATKEKLKDFPNVKVIKLEKGYVAHLARDLNVDYLIRGVRNKVDKSYEDHMSKNNKMYNKGLKTIYILSDKKHSNLSSSKIKSN